MNFKPQIIQKHEIKGIKSSGSIQNPTSEAFAFPIDVPNAQLQSYVIQLWNKYV